MSISALLRSMTALVRAELTPESTARALSLDLSEAHVTRAPSGGAFIIADATRAAFPRHPGLVAFRSPNAISIVLSEDERLHYVAGLIEGDRPRIRTSPHAPGFSSLALLDGATVGCCVDERGTVMSLFCDAGDRWP